MEIKMANPYLTMSQAELWLAYKRACSRHDYALNALNHLRANRWRIKSLQNVRQKSWQSIAKGAQNARLRAYRAATAAGVELPFDEWTKLSKGVKNGI